eukprot:gene11006-12827_t
MSDPFADDNIESVEVHEEFIEGDYVPQDGESVEVLDGDWSADSVPQATSNGDYSNSSSFTEAKPKPVEISSAMKEFQDKHEKDLKEKQRVSEEKRQKKIDDAKKSLENFYAERETKKKTALKNNRDHNKTLESDSIAASSGKDDSWEAVVSMIDITTKSASSSSSTSADKTAATVPAKDTSRMREVLIRLKNKAI